MIFGKGIREDENSGELALARPRVGTRRNSRGAMVTRRQGDKVKVKRRADKDERDDT
jgi:hypothetical protein